MDITESVKKYLVHLENGTLNYSAPVIFIIICALIILDLLGVVTVTFPIVGLILLLLLLPYVQYIQRVRWGPFEAELDRQLKEVEENVRSLSNNKSPESLERQRIVADQINNYLQDDPRVAISALWIEIEETLRNVLYDNEYDDRFTFSILLDDMADSDVINSEILDNVWRIRDLRNEALHGGEVTQEETKRIIHVGIMVLGQLYEHADLSEQRGLVLP